MIQNDEQLARAQQAVVNLQRFLLEARKAHSAREYRAMSEPILLETGNYALFESCSFRYSCAVNMLTFQ